jgi:hypothetical protein
VAGAEDPERRIRGADVRWSRSWSESFDDEVMSRVESFLRR